MHRNRLDGHVALITGAALGIGRACAELFAQEGARVAITDIRLEDAIALADELKAVDCVCEAWQLDVASEQDVERVVAGITEEFGPISVLVNNAGIAGADKPTHELTESEWDHVMAVNVKGVFFCTKHVIPHMQKRGGGSIINLSSIYGLISAPDIPAYHASKGAVTLMTKTDALLYAKQGIRVNSIHPGFIWTPLVEQFLADKGLNPGEGRAELAKLHPLGHVGEPVDIAFGALYLASDESKFVTGSELVIDGGYTAR